MKKNNCGTNETLLTKKENEKFDHLDSPFCQKNCKICNSPNHDLIMHMLLSEGATYRNVTTHILKTFGEKISTSSISRHMANYRKSLRSLSNKVDYANFNVDAQNVAKHKKEVLFLMDSSFRNILEKVNSGALVLGIDDYEKLTKLYYNFLENPEGSGNEDIVALFQKASKKSGFSIDQGVLLKTKRPRE